jgi:pSer/pThr/pTyr-binding forkhead associated (FHA) protein
VTDLGSTNGTFVDGEKISSGELADGSRIKIGRTQIIVHFGSW